MSSTTWAGPAWRPNWAPFPPTTWSGPRDADIAALAKSDSVAVSLPCTPFGLAESGYTPAQKILAADGLLALATDCNPGTAWCESMQFVIALACRALKLTPAQAIAAATINAAHAIRRADRIGSIEPGKQADLLVLSVPDYRQLGYRFGTNLVKQVVKRGKVYMVETGYSSQEVDMNINIVPTGPILSGSGESSWRSSWHLWSSASSGTMS